jgi:phosphohistidine swiveling domain-containing protein
MAVFDAEKAAEWAAEGKDVLLVRVETSPEDLKGMTIATGILTARGGMTSHAAVVTRQIGKPCVSAVSELDVDLNTRVMTLAGKEYAEGEMITIDGSTGEVFMGAIPTTAAGNDANLNKILTLADTYRRLGVWTNADTGIDAARARELGAEGIGLTRTEHMFFDADKLIIFREAILAETDEARDSAIGRLLPMQARRAWTNATPHAIAPPDCCVRSALAACGLRGAADLDGRPAGHHPAARPTAPRVPAGDAGGHPGDGDADERLRRGRRGHRRAAPRAEPHARPPWLPARHHHADALRDAGAGDHRGHHQRDQGRRRRPPEDHDPAHL